MKILVLNCGSSSIKYQLIDMENSESVLAKGVVERIGENGNSCFTHKPVGKDEYYIETYIDNHEVGVDFILKALLSEKHGVITSINEISACGHRIVHGGEYFSESTIIGDQEIKWIENLCKIAPLHNPGSLLGINAIKDLLPNIKQVCVFDTSFHQTIPTKAFLYGIPYKYYEEMKIRRYGFHGTSHKYVSERVSKMLDFDLKEKKVITCHLGNGASLCAINKGKSIDTSMGFTPLEGLIMGTRSGDLDIGALLHIAENENLDYKQMNDLVNKKSGLLGITGVTNDMRDLVDRANAGDQKCLYALEMFAYRVKKYIGSYIAAMNGVDYIVMTGGMGENNHVAREKILSDLECFGIEFDKDLNLELNRKEGVISKENSKVKVIIVQTNEELVIARDTYNLIK